MPHPQLTDTDILTTVTESWFCLLCPSLATVQSSDYSYQSPVMMFSQYLIINAEFLIVILMRADTRPSQANNVNQLSLSQLCSNQQSLPSRIPGNISNSYDKDISSEDWGRVYYCPCWPLISRSGVSCFRRLYICVIQTSHTSCQQNRCHAIHAYSDQSEALMSWRQPMRGQ